MPSNGSWETQTTRQLDSEECMLPAPLSASRYFERDAHADQEEPFTHAGWLPKANSHLSGSIASQWLCMFYQCKSWHMCQDTAQQGIILASHIFPYPLLPYMDHTYQSESSITPSQLHPPHAKGIKSSASYTN